MEPVLSFLISRWRAVRRVASTLRALQGPARVAAIGRLLEWPGRRDRRVREALAAQSTRLVIVCHGNIMRSAFAVAYLRQQAPALADRIVGAGTHATAGRAAQDSALRVAPAFGVSLADHGAQPLEAVGLTAQDVVVCMDRANEANVIARWAALAPRVFLIGDLGAVPAGAGRDVVDPYARGDEATRVAFARIQGNAQAWLAVLTPPPTGEQNPPRR
jgi:protein-tyrosine-phosphatase